MSKQADAQPVAMPARRSFPALGPSFYARGWNACLDEIAKLGPLYTHADADEVERLRGKVETMRCKNNELHDELDTLRAQLVEVARRYKNGTLTIVDVSNALEGRLYTLAEASAKPSPTCCGSCPGGCTIQAASAEAKS